MDLIRLDQNDITGFQWMNLIVLLDRPFTSQHVDFMLVRMVMARRKPARLHLKLPHGKVGSPIMLVHEPPDLTARRAFHVHGPKGNFVTCLKFHRDSILFLPWGYLVGSERSTISPELVRTDGSNRRDSQQT